jgi:hypothetical protein
VCLRHAVVKAETGEERSRRSLTTPPPAYEIGEPRSPYCGLWRPEGAGQELTPRRVYHELTPRRVYHEQTRLVALARREGNSDRRTPSPLPVGKVEGETQRRRLRTSDNVNQLASAEVYRPERYCEAFCLGLHQCLSSAWAVLDFLLSHNFLTAGSLDEQATPIRSCQHAPIEQAHRSKRDEVAET